MKNKHIFPQISLYAGFLTLLLATGWLLPNHYPPWNTFHTEAWTAGALALIGLWVLLRGRHEVRVSWFALGLFFCALLPVLQHAIGLLPLPGQALMGTLFILGFALAYLLGLHWQRIEPDRPMNMILGAALAASLVSAGMALYQWTGLAREPEFDDIWVVPLLAGGRPYANFAQPNQLASMLLWGLMGVLWFWHKRRLSLPWALAASFLLLFAVALTESRTAWLSLSVALAMLTLRRPAFVSRRMLHAAQGLYVFYLGCLVAVGPLSRLLLLDASTNLFARTGGEMRWAIWRMALDAATRHPWLGYGWNQTPEAYVLVYPDHPVLSGILVAQSHNLPLDLVLWFGWPVALVLLAAAAFWLLRLARSVVSMEQLVMAGALGVLGMHALLELPLHHGYFLWPLGVVAGAAAASFARAAWPAFAVSAKVFVLALCATAAVAGVVVRDYFLVEQSFADLRFELLRVGTNHPQALPDTILLSEWSDFIAMSRAKPHAGMPEEEIRNWRNMIGFHTSPAAFTRLVAALALNGRDEEARYWAERSCLVMNPQACQRLAAEWLSGTQAPRPASSKND